MIQQVHKNVVPTSISEELRSSYLEYAMSVIVTRALPDVRVHDLRHSFASSAIMDTVPLATIGKLLGHLLPETTAKYAHLADDVIADAAKRISGSLASAIGLRA